MLSKANFVNDSCICLVSGVTVVVCLYCQSVNMKMRVATRSKQVPSELVGFTK